MLVSCKGRNHSIARSAEPPWKVEMMFSGKGQKRKGIFNTSQRSFSSVATAAISMLLPVPGLPSAMVMLGMPPITCMGFFAAVIS